MPRRPRVFVAGAWYHVYCRASRGERAFEDPREAGALVEAIREVKKEHGLGVAAWCVMATHYHVAVRAGRQPLWRSMLLIQGRYARGRKRRLRTLGPFWQSRYQAVLVTDERQLRQLVAYIHLNPVAAKVVRDPARARWSGHRELLGQVREPLADADEALLLFGSRRASAREAYVRALRGAREAPWMGADAGRLPWWRRSPDDAALAAAEGVPRVDALGASTAQAPHGWSTEAYVAAACRARGAEPADLRGGRRAEGRSATRELVLLVGVETFGLKVKDLAAAFRLNPGSASRALGRAAARDREHPEFHEARLALEARLGGTEPSPERPPRKR